MVRGRPKVRRSAAVCLVILKRILIRKQTETLKWIVSSKDCLISPSEMYVATWSLVQVSGTQTPRYRGRSTSWANSL